MSTEAKREGNKRHQLKLDRIVIQPQKDEGERIRSAAMESGESLQGYILSAVRDRMERYKAE